MSKLRSTKGKPEQWFRAGVKKWINTLHLGSWYINYERKPLSGHRLAEVLWAHEDRCVTVRLASTCSPEKQNEVEIERAALHEALEVLFAPVYRVVERHNIPDPEINEAVHIVIRTLEKVLVEEER